MGAGQAAKVDWLEDDGMYDTVKSAYWGESCVTVITEETRM